MGTPSDTPLTPGELAALSLLDNVETNDGVTHQDEFAYEPPAPDFSVEPASNLETSFRHSGWHHRRSAVFAALRRTGASATRLDRFAQCGSSCRVYFHLADEKFALRANYCRDRWCTPCSRSHAHKLAATLQPHLRDGTTWLVTLTLRQNETPLRDQLTRLRRSFVALRKTELWRTAVSGGLSVLEVKRSRNTGKWHPHFHLIVKGRKIDNYRLSKEWHSITGDSYITDVRPIKTDGVGAYVAKYLTKPAPADHYRDADTLDEMILALAGTRRVNTFGEWRGIPLNDPPEQWSPDDWICLGSLEQTYERAKAGSTLHAHAWNQLNRQRRIYDERRPP